MRSRNILTLVIQAAITLTLAGLLPLTAQARGDDHPPKLSTKSKTVGETVSDSLFKLGCKRFLGRADEYLCTAREAMLACEAFKQDGKAKACTRAKPSGPPKISPTPKTDAEVAGEGLAKLGCTHFLGRADEYLCKSREAVLTCEAFKSGGLAKACRAAKVVSASHASSDADGPPKIDTQQKSISDVVSDSLSKLGCAHFLGRPGDFLCKGREALFTCEALKKDGKAAECRRDDSSAKKILPPATDAEIARSSLLKLGGKLFLGRQDEFICDTREERLVCDTFKAAGLVSDCHVPGRSN